MPISSVHDMGGRMEFPGGPGRFRLVSVPEPVFDADAKYDLSWRFKAHCCDMEAGPLLGVLGGLGPIAEEVTVHFCKVAGDRPEDAELYRHEEALRQLRSQAAARGFLARWWAALRFPGGRRKLISLQEHKAQANAGLTQALHDCLKRVLESGGRTDNLDSLFFPH